MNATTDIDPEPEPEPPSTRVDEQMSEPEKIWFEHARLAREADLPNAARYCLEKVRYYRNLRETGTLWNQRIEKYAGRSNTITWSAVEGEYGIEYRVH